MPHRNEDLFSLAAAILVRPGKFSVRGYEAREHAARRHREIADDLIVGIRQIERRLYAGVGFLGYTLWSESQEAREMRRAAPEKYEQAVELWIGLLYKYQRKIGELERYGVKYEYCPPDEYEPLWHCPD